MNQLKLICETIGYDTYVYNEIYGAFVDDELDIILVNDVLYSNDFMNKLATYIDSVDGFVDGPTDDTEINIRATIDYSDPIQYILDIIII